MALWVTTVFTYPTNSCWINLSWSLRLTARGPRSHITDHRDILDTLDLLPRVEHITKVGGGGARTGRNRRFRTDGCKSNHFCDRNSEPTIGPGLGAPGLGPGAPEPGRIRSATADQVWELGLAIMGSHGVQQRINFRSTWGVRLEIHTALLLGVGLRYLGRELVVCYGSGLHFVC
jgi:hypothetical protein